MYIFPTYVYPCIIFYFLFTNELILIKATPNLRRSPLEKNLQAGCLQGNPHKLFNKLTCFSCVCPVIDHEFHHNIVKVAGDP